MEKEGLFGGAIGGLPLVETVSASLEVLVSEVCCWSWSKASARQFLDEYHWSRFGGASAVDIRE